MGPLQTQLGTRRKFFQSGVGELFGSTRCGGGAEMPPRSGEDCLVRNILCPLFYFSYCCFFFRAKWCRPEPRVEPNIPDRLDLLKPSSRRFDIPLPFRYCAALDQHRFRNRFCSSYPPALKQELKKAVQCLDCLSFRKKFNFESPSERQILFEVGHAGIQHVDPPA